MTIETRKKLAKLYESQGKKNHPYVLEFKKKEKKEEKKEEVKQNVGKQLSGN